MERTNIKRVFDKPEWEPFASVFLLCAITSIPLNAQTFTTLHSFNGTDGANPQAQLVQATNGELYGTTLNSSGPIFGGTIFSITPSGSFATVYAFCAKNACPDGYHPYAGVVQATNGNFYGTTFTGGASVNGGIAVGTVFAVTPSGTLTTLYNFCSQAPSCADGVNPQAGVIQATNGDFYGSTVYGGSSGNGYGTLFKITPGGLLTKLYSFCPQMGCADGEYPTAALVQATDGNFYGTTTKGGQGMGTLFKMTPGGVFATVHTFCTESACKDSGTPSGALIQANDGNLYGATSYGGAYRGGTIFEITLSGAFTTLYSFCPQAPCLDGAFPNGLIQASNGDFYGTTFEGGLYNGGTVFQITPSGVLTTIHHFCNPATGCPDGGQPVAAITQDTNGHFYGTTQTAGAGGYGTVFSLSVGLRPFVTTQTTSGEALSTVKILGTNLTGATSVTFNGAQAAFKVKSKSLLLATVPKSATSGTVDVATPRGTLQSNVPFRVLP